MSNISKWQMGAIYGIMKKINRSDDKDAVVREISNNRTNSMSSLTYNEANEWIKAMNAALGTKKPLKPADEKRQRMINSIIAMAREMGVIVRRSVIEPGGSMKVVSDYTEFNKWMREKSTGKKILNEYKTEELPQLVTQYKAIYSSWLKKYH